MDDRARITASATELAEAIGRKDAAALDRLLAPDFRLRAPGGRSTRRDAFIRAVCEIPAEVLSVTLTDLEIDLGDGSALVSGQQHARCRFHGEVISRGPAVRRLVPADRRRALAGARRAGPAGGRLRKARRASVPRRPPRPPKAGPIAGITAEIDPARPAGRGGPDARGPRPRPLPCRHRERAAARRSPRGWSSRRRGRPRR